MYCSGLDFKAQDGALTTNKKFYDVFNFLLKFVVPPILVLLMLFGLGLV